MNAPGATTLVEITGADGTPFAVTLGVGHEDARAVIRLSDRLDLRSGILICQHLPAARDGRDLYEVTRAVQTGHWCAIASTSFPTDRLPPAWIPALQAMDEVWVPGAFNVATFARSGVDRARLHAVPLRFPILERPAHPGAAYAFDTRPAFRFLAVLSLDERKNWKLLLRAWLDAFRPGDDVGLALRLAGLEAGPRAAEAALETIAAYIGELGRDPGDVPEISVITDPLDRRQLADVMAQCDAFVLPSRAEAWCQPMFEAHAMGLPVIATRWGGPLAYLDDANAFLVDVAGMADVPAAALETHPHFAGHRWAEPDLASLVETMRRVRQDQDDVRRRTRRAVAAVAERWTREHAVGRMTARLAAIERALPHGRAPAPCTEPVRVFWRAAVYDQSGYASEARAYLKGLHERGFDCKVGPLVWSSRVASLDLEDRLLFHRLCELPIESAAISVQHYFPPQFQRAKRFPIAIGRTMFETDRIPESWVAPCNAMEEIWVPSTQNVESFSASGVAREKLFVVPGTFDFASYGPGGPRHQSVPEGPFTFLTVFDWHLRKGWDVLLRAYAEAFPGKSDVQLVMKLQLSNGLPMDVVAKIVKKTMSRFLPRGKSAPPVVLLGKLPERELPALYRSADAFVLPTRGEGYGRPFAEAMAVGVPAIGTRWSGQVDFMDDRNSWLIDHRLVPVSEEALREVPTFRGHRWAEPDAGHLRRILLEARGAPDVVAAKGAQAAQDVRAKLSPERVIGILKSRLEHWLARL
jgi:glycosyltransferase involved in cell wall biosynthesis